MLSLLFSQNPIIHPLPSEILINKRRTIANVACIGDPKLRLSAHRRIARCKPKAMPTLPVIALIKRISPAHSIAQRVCPRSDPRRVGAVVACALVDAFVEGAENALDCGADAVDVGVCVVAQLAVLVRCLAVTYAVERVVRGWAVAV